jgi:chemotaxis protein histidine kinase CheA
MENFRRQFVHEAVETLENLSNDLRATENLSDSARHAAFRTLHTIKGTAQTFGFSVSSRLAHELESLLSAGKSKEATERVNSKSLFSEGIALLIATLQRKNFEVPASFTEKIRQLIPDEAAKNTSDNGFPEIPEKLFAQLSNQEKTALRSALENGKNLFCLEIGFKLEDFADGLINFREVLSDSGEIIATLPSAKHSGDRKIGFQILLASAAETSCIETIAAEKQAEIIFDSSSANVFSNDAAGILAQIVKHGTDTAEKLGKQIEFETFADKITVSPERLKIIFDVLLHLVRNAVDHAIVAAGKIEIHLKIKDNQLILIVSDDGSGIDTEQLKTKAIEKNVISREGLLTEQEAINLIFLPEFSTKSDVTEISGRGIGLDAVKFAVEKARGKINVKSVRGKGTTFEISLRQ